MNRRIQYTSPTTGNPTRHTANIPDPSFELRWTGTGDGSSREEEVHLITNDGNYPFAYPMVGMERNRIDGGPFVPSGELDGHETYSSAAITATDTEFTPMSHRTAENALIFSTGAYFLVMDRHPKPEECANIFGVADLNAEIVKIGTYVADTAPVDLDGATAFANNHPKGAVIQKIIGVSASYNLDTGEKGYKYNLEVAGMTPTIVTSIDGGTQTIDITFKAVETSYPACKGYMVAVVKKGGALSVYGAPTFIPQYVLPAEKGSTELLLSLSSADLSLASGVYTLEGISKYYDPATKALTAIVAGTYYVVLWAVNATTRNENFRLSAPDISTAVVVA
jgi:hypothetical protein